MNDTGTTEAPCTTRRKSGLVANVFTIGSLTAASRILGFIRDLVCAWLFGTSRVWDVFVIAFTIPNLFRCLFGEGALSSAFIPAFVTRKENESVESAGRLLNRVIGWMLKVLGVVVVAGMVGAAILAPIGGKIGMVCESMVTTTPYLLLICITAIFGAALNSVGRFASPAAAPLVLNLVMIVAAFASLWTPGERAQLWVLSGAVVVGGAAQLAMQLPALAASGLRVWPDFSTTDDESFRQVLSAFAPAVLGLAVIQVNELLDNVIAATMIPGDGAVSAIYYGNRLNQLPLGVIGFSVATAAFPKMAVAAARRDFKGVEEALLRSMRLALWAAIPAAMGLASLAPELTSLLFERGKFTADATARTWPVVMAYALGIPFYVANMVLTRAYYAMKDMKTPVRVSLTTVGLNFVLNVVGVLVLAEAGIALATSITGVANFALLTRGLKRKNLCSRDGAWTLRAALAACLAAVAAMGTLRVLGVAPLLVVVSASVAVAIAVHFGASLALGLSEAREFLALSRLRVGR